MKYLLIILFLIFNANVFSQENDIENVKFPDSDIFFNVEKQPVVDVVRLKSLVKYPKDAYNYRVEGTVIVKVLVGKDGKIIKSKIEYSDSPLFNKSALYAIKSYGDFEPASLNGVKVACWISIPITYNIGKKVILENILINLNFILNLFF